MKRIIVASVAALSFLVPAGPVYADHGGRDDGSEYDEGCGRNGGGCNNERHEDYGGAGCKYVCPSFDKSPVHDAFNFDPQICMPGATCNFEDRKKKEEAPK